jgi:hypothetical protein
MICPDKTQMRIWRRKTKKSMGISSRGKTIIKMKKMKKKRLIKDSKSTNRRCYNNWMIIMKMRILITQSLTHMTCHCNEIWAQTQ